MTISRKAFFFKEATLTGSFVTVPLGMVSTNLRFVAVSTAAAEFSFNGTDTDGKVDTNDKVATFDGVACDRVFVKGTGVLRIYAWTKN